MINVVRVLGLIISLNIVCCLYSLKYRLVYHEH